MDTKENKKNNAGTTRKMPIYSEYFKKKLYKITPELKKRIEETAKTEAEVEDEFGSYKPGTFTHRACIVTVRHDDETWTLHIWSDQPISDILVREVRERFIPDYAVMARLYGSRESSKKLSGVILYEIPGASMEDLEG